MAVEKEQQGETAETNRLIQIESFDLELIPSQLVKRKCIT